MSLKPYQKRVIKERKKLLDKIIKLTDFINDVKFDNISSKDKDILLQQIGHMSLYSASLSKRIELFTK